MLKDQNNPKVLAAITDAVKSTSEKSLQEAANRSSSFASKYSSFKPATMAAAKKAVELTEAKKLDPVGKEDADIDNDGDTDKSDEYLHNRRKAIKKAMKEDADQVDEQRFEKGEDVGRPGLNFKKIAKEAGKKYGSKEAGQRVAGSILKKVLRKEEGVLDEDNLEKRIGINAVNRKPRAGQTNLKNIPAGNYPGSQNKFTDRDKDLQKDQLKKDIKAKAGTHKKPNLPEEAELDEARGRPRKDASAGDDSGPEPDAHIHVQLKKAADSVKDDVSGKGGADVKFDNGSQFVNAEHAKKVLGALDKLKPADREKLHNHIKQSHANFQAVHKLVS